MFWTRVAAVAMATLFIGSLSLAQDAQPEPAPDKTTEGDAKPSVDPNKAPEGKFKIVTVSEIKLKDEARSKELSLAAIFPEEAGKYPVILFSHSAGSSNDRSLTLPQYWAAHGFVVLVPNHADARQRRGGMNADQMFEQYDKDKDGKLSKEELPEQMQAFFDMLDSDSDGFLTKEEMSAFGGRGGRGGRGQQPEDPEKPKEEPNKPGEDDFDMLGDSLDSFIEDPAQPAPPQPGRGQGRGQGRGRGFAPAPLDAKIGIDRVADLKLILDSAKALIEAEPRLKDKLDLDKVGVAGHNAGAYTAELIGGAGVNVEEIVKAEDGTESKELKSQNLLDKRVKSILALSPAGADQGGLTKESFKTLALPMMTMTGSEDTTGEGQDAKWKKQPFELAPEGSKYHVYIEGASNWTFGGAQPRMGRGGQQQPANPSAEWVKTSSLMFWNATLKGDEEAKKWLSGDSLKEATEGKATIERR